MKTRLINRRVAATAAAVALVVAIGGCSLLAGGGSPAPTQSISASDSATYWPTASPYLIAVATPTLSPSPGATVTPSVSASPPGSGFQPIDMFATRPPQSDPTPGPSSNASPTRPRPTYHSTDAPFFPSDARPSPDQSLDWMVAKSEGRVVLAGGVPVMLGATVNPLLMPQTGKALPTARSLGTSWTRWIVEPPGRGTDEMGTVYTDRSYWNFCGPGASAVTLYYWQQLVGHPNVTGTAGYFLDPYAAEGASWPSPGPSIPRSNGKLIGTYWSGSDTVSGFTAHGRGFVMYMATKSQPPTWTAPGVTVWADENAKAYYPTRGSSLANIQTGLNWEASGRNTGSWIDTWYGTVNRWDPTLARDLQVAVMMDVGRDGVPVVAGVDTYDLPNWQDGTQTPHTRHAVSIVGYDNKANPPTFTYIDTCGRACNPRGGNRNGQLHVIAQSQMVAALQDAVGMGFIW